VTCLAKTGAAPHVQYNLNSVSADLYYTRSMVVGGGQSPSVVLQMAAFGTLQSS